MKVLDIIKPACAYLGLYSDYVNYFEPALQTETQDQDVLENQISVIDNLDLSTTIPQDKKETLSLLLLSTNNMQEKVLKTIPIKTMQTVMVESNKIKFSELTNKVNKILNVLCENKKVKFKVLNNLIVLSPDLTGEVQVEYSYFLPYIESLSAETTLDSVVKTKTMALGVASEYCYISGLFDDAEIWNKKFLQELTEDGQKIKNFITKKRSWR